MTSRRVVFGLGSNLGSRESLLRAAADLIAATPGIAIEARSRVFQTPPVGPAQPDYLNAAVSFHSALPGTELLDIALSIERRLGRARRERWGPRTLDIDVLWIEGEAFSTPALTVPHPELSNRAFALAPLLDVAADARNPRTGEALAVRLQTVAPASPFVSFPLTDHFEVVFTQPPNEPGFSVCARDRADLFAAAAEALGRLAVNPASVQPRSAIPVEVVTRDADTAHDRLTAWLSRVHEEIRARRFALRRAVLFEETAAMIRGALLGEALDETRHIVLGEPASFRIRRIEIRDCCAEFSIVR